MYRLCYVDDFEHVRYGGLLYFTDNFEHQWGDDWDDAPYECNAGEPYRDGTHSGNIRVFAFLCCGEDVATPSMQTGLGYSVKDINCGVVPWLCAIDAIRALRGEDAISNSKVLRAGASIAEARKFMREIGAKFGELK